MAEMIVKWTTGQMRTVRLRVNEWNGLKSAFGARPCFEGSGRMSGPTWETLLRRGPDECPDQHGENQVIAHVELEGLEKVEVNRSGSQIKTDWLDEKGKVECTTTIQLPKGAKQSQVSDKSAEALGMAAMNANDANIELSSISRNARQQAAAMFENAEVPGVGVAGLYNDYGSAGERVADVYALGKTIQTVSQLFGGEGVSNSQIIDAMEGEVNRQGLRNVTNHAADPSVLQVFDIRPSSVEDKPAMMRSIESMTGKGRTFEKKIFPSAGSSERGYHVEVLQSKPK